MSDKPSTTTGDDLSLTSHHPKGLSTRELPFFFRGWGFVLQCLEFEAERENAALIIAAANLGLRDIVKFGIVLHGAAIEDSYFQKANNLPFVLWVQEISAIISTLDVESACVAGLRFIAGLKGPSYASSVYLSERSPTGSYVYSHTVALYRPISAPYLTFATACVANARFLGIPIGDVMSTHAQSPFCTRNHESISQSISGTLPLRGTYCYEYQQVLTSSLAPTTEQLILPHHPYIDTLPWPSFRSRIINAMHSGVPVIDQDELALDFVHNGIRCWGTSHGSGDGAPWDARSWEAMPWFLEKWSILF